MTEAEWLATTDPAPMLEFLRRKAGNRKLRLLAVAKCQSVWTMLPVACQNLNDMLERYADELVTTDEYLAAWDPAAAEVHAADHDSPDALTYATASVGVSDPPTVPAVLSGLDTVASAVAYANAQNAPDINYDTTYEAAWRQERQEQVRLVLDIFGNPFRPSTSNLSWLTSTVRGLAEGIYADRAFDRMPILADALEDAGCDHADILAHCRGDGPHVRGCWVVDLLLGKE